MDDETLPDVELDPVAVGDELVDGRLVMLLLLPILVESAEDDVDEIEKLPDVELDSSEDDEPLDERVAMLLPATPVEEEL